MTASANAALRSARQALGLRSQVALAEALNKAANDIGLRISINARTVRRWESADPPLPQREHVAALESFFGRPISELGFTVPWSEGGQVSTQAPGSGFKEAWAARCSGASASALPASVATDLMNGTASHRRMYWSVPASRLQRLVAEHAALGWDLLTQVPATAKPVMARAVSESSLLAGRLEFFDLQLPDQAKLSFVLALQAAREADDSLLGAAALAHMAFAPAFSGDPDQAEDARDKIRGARAFARRGDANAEMTAWLDAVEAEVETRFGDTRRALTLIRHAEEEYSRFDAETHPSPPWLDWFSPIRLAGFKGNTLAAAGRPREARETLQQALADLPDSAVKQRSVYYADLAAVSVLERDPDRACDYLNDALRLIGEHWYATAMDRVKDIRESLREWDSLPKVRALDDELYSWHATVKSMIG